MGCGVRRRRGCRRNQARRGLCCHRGGLPPSAGRDEPARDADAPRRGARRGAARQPLSRCRSPLLAAHAQPPRATRRPARRRTARRRTRGAGSSAALAGRATAITRPSVRPARKRWSTAQLGAQDSAKARRWQPAAAGPLLTPRSHLGFPRLSLHFQTGSGTSTGGQIQPRRRMVTRHSESVRTRLQITG